MKTSLLRRTVIVSLLAIVSLFFLYFLTTGSSAPVHAQPSEKLEMTGNITNQAAAEACLAVLKENLQAASDQDATAYAATLVAAARAETTQELADFLQKNSCSTRCFLLKSLNKRQDPCWSRLNRKRSAQRLFLP